MKILFFTGLLFALMFLPGCTSERIAFTQELREKYQLVNGDLQNLQYYVSQDLLLERDAISGESKIVRGKLTTKAGRLIDQILVEKGTPGVAVQAGAYWLAVSFEKNAALFFTCRLGITKKGKYYLGTRGNAKLKYNGNIYDVTGSGIQTHLLIDRKSLTDLVKKRKILPGRWVQLKKNKKNKIDTEK